jgi:hypothetical protein
MSSDQVQAPEWKEGEKRTAKDLLESQEAARNRVVSMDVPKVSFLLESDDSTALWKDRVNDTQMRIAAAGASAMYEVPAKDIGQLMGGLLDMPARTPDEQKETRLPFMECRLRETLTPQASPIGIVKHYTYMKEKSALGKVDDWYAKDLYIFWRGSHDFLDWACDANASLTNSHHPDVQVHGGMFARFNEFKDDLEQVMKEFLERDTKHDVPAEPRRVYFVGHSLGAGLAMLSHFQLYAARKDSDWPSSPEVRDFAKDPSNGVFMIGFAGPPVFHIKCGAGAEESVKDASERGVNVTMEYDVVPRMMNVSYCKQVLRACSQGEINRSCDSPLSKLFVKQVTKRPIANAEELLDRNAVLMTSLQHMHPIFMQYNDKNEQTWNWTVIPRESFSDHASFEWPFKANTSASMPTLMPATDHSVFPGRVDATWGEDTCSVCGTIPLESTAKWFDCMHCQDTFCAACYERKHRDPAKGEIVSWHESSQRSLDVKRSVRVTFHLLGQKAAQLMNDMRYNAMLCKTGADVFKPTNIWLVAELFRETSSVGQIVKSLGDVGGNLATAGQAVSKTLGPAECIFVGAIAVVESGWLCYKRWGTGELDCAHFWMKLGACWGAAAGQIGGMFGGAFIGGLIGSIFGPVGAVVGALVGAAVGGAVGGAAGRYGSEALIKWALGLNTDQKEKANWSIIGRAMHVLGLEDTKPSKLIMRQLRKAQRGQALIHHPDKTGLVGKKDLTDPQKVQLSNAATKFHEIQTHFDTLSVFIEERDKPTSPWKSNLTSLDNYCEHLIAKFSKIDQDAADSKNKAMRKLGR